MSTTIQQPSTMSGGSDWGESTTAPFLCKAPQYETSAASSHFQSADILCRSSIMRWDTGLAGQPSIMAEEWAVSAHGHIRWHPEPLQEFSPALIPKTILTIAP